MSDDGENKVIKGKKKNKKKLFRKILSEIPSECQTVPIQIRPDIVCKGYQHTTIIADKELMGASFVCFAAIRPKSTAMVMAGQSDHLTTLFPGQA